MKSSNSRQIKTMAEVALVAALICILGPFSVPVGLIPVSLTPFAVFLAVYVLGMKRGTYSVLLYLLIGLIGLPVFSGFSGGAAKLFGPTGGFLIGFIPLALISGFFIDRFYHNLLFQAVGMFLGLLVLYLAGALWLSYQAHLSLADAITKYALPFIGIDGVKLIAALVIGRILRESLVKAGLLDNRTPQVSS